MGEQTLPTGLVITTSTVCCHDVVFPAPGNPTESSVESVVFLGSFRVPIWRAMVEDAYMVELLGAALVTAIVVSLSALGLYLVIFLTACTSTIQNSRHDRKLTRELDRFLARVLGPR